MISSSVVPILEVGQTLFQGTPHAGNAVAQDQQEEEGHDQKFGRTNFLKEGKWHH
jgi:hypothetical protein